jgi:hypothetical protein
MEIVTSNLKYYGSEMEGWVSVEKTKNPSHNSPILRLKFL